MSSRLLAGRKHAKRIHDSSEEEEEADAVRSSVDSSNKTEGNAAESSKEDPPKRKKKSGGNWQLSAEKSVHSHIDSISRRRLISGKQVLEDQIYIEKEFVERILSWRINKSKEIEKESLSEVVLQEMDLSRKGNLRFSDAEHYIEFFESLIYEECKVKAQSELINNAKPVEVISLKSILSDSEEDGVVIRSRFKLSFEPNQKHSFQEPKELVALELEIKPQYQGSSVKRVFKLAFSNQAA